MSVSHDQTENMHLIYMLTRLLPGSIPGVDYATSTDYEQDGVTINKNAYIHHWGLTELTQPTNAELKVHWDTTYKAAWLADETVAATAEANRIAAVITNALI